ncbi:MAG TPA: hypothetical protein VMT70_14305 [Vicinamibacteria bacterium]|nr:hypothetical protein [Vicinamibacteria bacterium]
MAAASVDELPALAGRLREAARRLGVSAAYLYKNAKTLPFTVRIGRRLLCSTAKLTRWSRTRSGA